jgi:hypothetical protein
MGAPKSTTETLSSGVDDLFQGPCELPQLSDSGPFVINLSSSTIPTSLPENGIPLTRNTRIYQIRRVEDQRVRYRLRLGPFLTENQANAVLGIVREGYPAALTATANTEDLEALADIQFDTIAAQPASNPPPVSVASAAAKPSAVAAAPVLPIAVSACHDIAPMSAPPLLQTAVLPRTGTPASQMRSMPAAKVRATGSSASAPPDVLPTAVRAQSTATARGGTPQAAKPVKVAPISPPSSVVTASSETLAHQVSTFLTSIILELVPDDKPQVGTGKVTPHRQAPPSRRVSEEHAAIDLETTQTMRALTTSELEDGSRVSHWYSIALSVSDRAFDPDAIPDLDIFSVYRLYVIESQDQGRAVHTLRLGFFAEEVAASAVADYLADHYQQPTVIRVSIAERERFSAQRVEARKRVEATGKHAVIEITDQRYVRELSVIPR